MNGDSNYTEPSGARSPAVSDPGAVDMANKCQTVTQIVLSRVGYVKVSYWMDLIQSPVNSTDDFFINRSQKIFTVCFLLSF